jgi:antitoxin ParD1/3/4
MNISLKPEHEQFVQSQIATMCLEETKQKIAIGLAQVEQGQVLDGPTVIERLKAKVQRARDAES